MQIEPNPTAMCVNCLRLREDITEGIPKQAQLYFCRNCERYLSPPAAWIRCDLESRELLALCLKRLKGLSKVWPFFSCFCSSFSPGTSVVSSGLSCCSLTGAPHRCRLHLDRATLQTHQGEAHHPERSLRWCDSATNFCCRVCRFKSDV